MRVMMLVAHTAWTIATAARQRPRPLRSLDRQERVMTGTLYHRDQSLVVPIAARSHEDLALAGGKGANLGELVRGGLSVPDAVVISTAAYTSVVESAGLAATIHAGLRGGDVAASVQRARPPPSRTGCGRRSSRRTRGSAADRSRCPTSA
jgi:hypothetical protein